MESGGGLITAQDLADYRVVERQPVRGSYKDFEIVSTPPPSSGGVHIVQMLNILEGYDLQAMGHNSAAYIHHLTESMKLAYADRSLYLADPDFVDVPVTQLIDKAYAEQQRQRIDSNASNPFGGYSTWAIIGQRKYRDHALQRRRSLWQRGQQHLYAELQLWLQHRCARHRHAAE